MARQDNPIWERTGVLVGEAGIERLAAARVLLAGLGGVGSFAAEALARAGIGELLMGGVDHLLRADDPPAALDEIVCSRIAIIRRLLEG